MAQPEVLPAALPEDEPFALDAAEKEALVALARRALENRVRHGRETDPSEVVARLPRLGRPRATFVTLRLDGALRGCIGSLAAVEPLASDVVRNAVNAALRDPRFDPVRPDELEHIRLSLSVLEPPRPLEGLYGQALARKLAETKPGVILEFRGRRSTFLPEVWEEVPDPEEFLGHLCLKQGSPVYAWEDPGIRVKTYGSQHFGEPDRL
jgi:AmmeMemoRadiSam system protein A